MSKSMAGGRDKDDKEEEERARPPRATNGGGVARIHGDDIPDGGVEEDIDAVSSTLVRLPPGGGGAAMIRDDDDESAERLLWESGIGIGVIAIEEAVEEEDGGRRPDSFLAEAEKDGEAKHDSAEEEGVDAGSNGDHRRRAANAQQRPDSDYGSDDFETGNGDISSNDYFAKYAQQQALAKYEGEEDVDDDERDDRKVDKRGDARESHNDAPDQLKPSRLKGFAESNTASGKGAHPDASVSDTQDPRHPQPQGANGSRHPPSLGPAATTTNVRPGAVQVQGRAAGRLPAWGRRSRTSRQASRQASLGPLMNLISMASSSRSGASRQQANSRNGSERRSDQIVVEMAELAPGEAKVEARPVPVRMETAYEGVVTPTVPPKEREGDNSWLKNHRCALCLVLVICAVIVAVAVPLSVRGSDVSGAPASAPAGADVLTEVVEELSGTEALRDPDSPQSESFRWLREEMQNASSSVSVDTLKQRYGLAVMFFSTGGRTHWTERHGFLSAKPECEWQGEDGRGVICNDLANVSEINLPENNMRGAIPGSELRAFPRLTKLNFARNGLQGTVPEELGDLTNLRHVSLDKNDLNGTLPFSMTKLSLLEFFNIEDNELTGSIPELGNLTSLRNVSLEKNDLNGTLPFSMTKLSQLEYFNVEQNQLTGSIPSAIGDMSNLDCLLISFNQLSSTLPPSWNELDQLRDFRLSGNGFNGTFPSCPECHPNLEKLAANKNLFSGTVPSSLSTLPKLRILVLHENLLNGTVPASLSNLSVLSLHSNSLTGTLPPELFASETLGIFFLGNNSFTGTLPSFAGSSQVFAFSAEENQLTGPIPSTYGNLSEMRLMSLHSNMLSGTIPSSFGEYPAIVSLMLEDNMLNGSIPETFSKLGDHIETLSLARNNLTGSLNSICYDTNITRFTTADCAGNSTAEVSCDCCTFCCDDNNDSCDYHVPILALADRCVVGDRSCVPEGFDLGAHE